MPALDNIKNIYFIGIGGIGMSALARYFQARGCRVSGYDKTDTALTRQLAAEGIQIMYEDDPAQLPGDVQLVVFTPAVPAAHRQLNWYRDNGYEVMKRSQVLGIISAGSFNICVGGTHGKTTITTLVAHLLRHSGYGCNAFLGGISVNYQTNFWSSDTNVCVIEADEYDRSFLQLSPDIAIISSMDPDHLDIYGTAEALEEAFIAFGSRVKTGGTVLVRHGLKRNADLVAGRILTYSRADTEADVYADNVTVTNGTYRFDVIHRDGETLRGLQLSMGGLHNVENAVAAIAVGLLLNIVPEKIKAAVAAFRGIRRRFEFIAGVTAQQGELTYIDDYAHHPEELVALISGARNFYPGKKCTVIFQPHLFSRTADLADGFAAALDKADEVILLPIYPAREMPVPGVTSNTISSRMKQAVVRLMEKEALPDYIRSSVLPSAMTGRPTLLITAGAGDIDTLITPIKNLIEQYGH